MKLEEIYSEFEQKIKEISGKAISDLVTEYVPYAKTDCDNNAFYKAKEIVEEFLAGNLLPDLLFEYSFVKVRNKIYEDHKEEIIKAIGVDKDQEILRLENTIERLINNR